MSQGINSGTWYLLLMIHIYLVSLILAWSGLSLIFVLCLWSLSGLWCRSIWYLWFLSDLASLWSLFVVSVILVWSLFDPYLSVICDLSDLVSDSGLIWSFWSGLCFILVCDSYLIWHLIGVYLILVYSLKVLFDIKSWILFLYGNVWLHLYNTRNLWRMKWVISLWYSAAIDTCKL